MVDNVELTPEEAYRIYNCLKNNSETFLDHGWAGHKVLKMYADLIRGRMMGVGIDPEKMGREE